MDICYIVEGFFRPKNTENLREEGMPYIGKLLFFQPMWKITEEDGGNYVGQWAFMACDKNLKWHHMGWVPEEDIDVIEIYKNYRPNLRGAVIDDKS